MEMGRRGDGEMRRRGGDEASTRKCGDAELRDAGEKVLDFHSHRASSAVVTGTNPKLKPSKGFHS